MKEKLINNIQSMKKINLLLIVFLAYSGKFLFSAPNFASAAILAVLGSIYAVSRYIALKEPQRAPNRLKNDVERIESDVREIKAALTKGNVAKITKKEQRYF